MELFAGNTADPATLASQVARIRQRFGMARVALVGDRGMITTARIRDDLEPAGLAWVSALKTADLPPAQQRVRAGARAGALVADAVAEITSPDFPGERLMVCLNPRLREDRRRTREALLAATEEVLETIAASVRAGTLKGAARIGHRVGRDANRRKVEKHFDITITDTSFSWRRRQERIDREARFDGVYVVRTSLTDIAPDAAVEAYKSLATVERAFRVAKSDLRIRPVWVYYRRSRSRARVPVHAGLLRGMAHAPAPRTAALRGRRPRGGAAPAYDTGREGSGLAVGQAQGAGKGNPRRSAGAQLPHPHR